MIFDHAYNQYFLFKFYKFQKWEELIFQGKREQQNMEYGKKRGNFRNNLTENIFNASVNVKPAI